MTASQDFDLIIVGAGPAGLTTALFLVNSGLKIAILERASLQKHKVCGDALSGTVIQTLKKLPSKIFEDFQRIPELIPSYGIRFVSPRGDYADIPFIDSPEEKDSLHGAILSRNIFETFLIQQVENLPDISLIPDCRVQEVCLTDDLEHVVLKTTQKTYSARMIVGADGASSIVGKLMAGNRNDRGRLCLGVRGYFSGVNNLHPENFIELHFKKETLPGYLWIFPMNNGISNVGLGIMAQHVQKRKISPEKLLLQLINEDKVLRERFSNATLHGKLETHLLPMGPQKKNIFGFRFLLTGDAASLIDPFTGEGIGNAMKSGEIAAKTIRKAFAENNFSREYLSSYDEEVERRILKEMKVNLMLSRLASFRFLLNLVIRKAGSDQRVNGILGQMYSNLEIRKKLKNPGFYLRMVTDPLYTSDSYNP